MKKLIFANWKMNLTAAASAELTQQIARGSWPVGLEIVLFPSFTALDAVRSAIGDNPLAVGAQDCFWEERGAFTGEVSPAQIKKLGSEYVLLGHSERRLYLHETDEMVNKKLKAAIAAGLVPVVCVGESEADRAAGRWAVILEQQIDKAFSGVDVSKVRRVIVAYEPVWAISTQGGKACSPEEAADVHSLIVKMLAELYGQASVKKHFSVIYGGSVDAKNVASYLREEGIDGALVGGASQKETTFVALLDAASKL